MPSVSCTPPTAREYAELRAAVGFGMTALQTAKAVLEATLVGVTVRDDQRVLVGFARAVGDGRLYAFITDVFVHPAAQGQGVGALLMDELMAQLLETAESNATIALVPARGREDFYSRFGFVTAPNDVFGSGMVHLGKVVERP